MPAASSDIYASEPLRHLLADEARGLLPELQRCKGDHGLLLSALAGDAPPALPMLACWTRLQLAGERLEGDMTARTDESLPFVDDAFELVLLRHALEACASPRTMLHEAVRVLAPGGLLVLSGMHPLSLWTPWLALPCRSSKSTKVASRKKRSALSRRPTSLARIEKVEAERVESCAVTPS